GPLRIIVDPQRIAVWIEREDLDIGFDNLQTLSRQMHIAGNLCRERLYRMQQRRASESRMEFFCAECSPNHAAPFEGQWWNVRLGKVKPGHESICAGADDDYSVLSIRHQAFHSLRIFRAAFSPGAPIMPPPGCVAEPHI